MTAYTVANMANGQATYRSAPQGAAVTTSTSMSGSLSTATRTVKPAKTTAKRRASKAVKRSK